MTEGVKASLPCPALRLEAPSGAVPVAPSEAVPVALSARWAPSPSDAGASSAEESADEDAEDASTAGEPVAGLVVAAPAASLIWSITSSYEMSSDCSASEAMPSSLASASSRCSVPTLVDDSAIASSFAIDMTRRARSVNLSNMLKTSAVPTCCLSECAGSTLRIPLLYPKVHHHNSSARENETAGPPHAQDVKDRHCKGHAPRTEQDSMSEKAPNREPKRTRPRMTHRSRPATPRRRQPTS